jgi:hypothetical protein
MATFLGGAVDKICFSSVLYCSRRQGEEGFGGRTYQSPRITHGPVYFSLFIFFLKDEELYLHFNYKEK